MGDIIRAFSLIAAFVGLILIGWGFIVGPFFSLVPLGFLFILPFAAISIFEDC